MSWLVVDPHVYVLALIAAALALRALGRGRASMVVTAAALALIVVAGVLPTGQIALWFSGVSVPSLDRRGPASNGYRPARRRDQRSDTLSRVRFQ